MKGLGIVVSVGATPRVIKRVHLLQMDSFGRIGFVILFHTGVTVNSTIHAQWSIHDEVYLLNIHNSSNIPEYFITLRSLCICVGRRIPTVRVFATVMELWFSLTV